MPRVRKLRSNETAGVSSDDLPECAMQIKKAGKVVGDYTIVVSKDGKTTTVNYTETGPEGKPINGSAVYDKQ